MLSAVDSKLGTNLAETHGTITEAADKFVTNIPNMNLKDWGKATGQVAFAIAGTKGLNAVKEFRRCFKSSSTHL